MPLVERSRDLFIKYSYIFFGIWALWLALEYLGLGPFSFVKIHDFGNSTFPMRIGLAQGLLENGLSGWFPQVVCGIDRLSTTQLDIFQIDSLLYLAFPGWLTQGLIVFIQRFLAGYFTYRLCKDVLKFNELTSLVAGLVYSMSFFYYQSQFFGEAGFPFILWSLERIAGRNGALPYVFAGLLGVLVSLSSSVSLNVPFILSIGLLWFLLVRRLYSRRFWSLYIVFAAVVVICKVPAVWSLFVNAPLSQRADRGEFEFFLNLRWLGWGQNSVYYLTAFSYLFGFVTLCLYKFRERVLLMMMALMIFCGIVANSLYLLIVQLELGLFEGFHFGRFALLVPFFSTIILAYCLHLLPSVPGAEKLEKAARRITRYPVQNVLAVVIIIVVVASSLVVKYHNLYDWGGGRNYTVNFDNPAMRELSADMEGSPPFRVATIHYRYLKPSYAMAYGLETVDGYIVIYPQTYQDYWGKVTAPLNNKDDYRKYWFEIGGKNVYLDNPSDGAFNTISEVPFSDYYNLDLLSLANARYIISMLPVVNEHLTLRYHHVGAEIPEPALSWSSIRKGLDYNFGDGMTLYIYENELYLPRFFITGNVSVFEDSDALLEALEITGVDTLRSTCFMEKEDIQNIDIERITFSEGQVTLAEYSPDRIVLTAELDGPGILVVTNNYNPDWTCRVDGVEKDIFPVYHTFQGIYLDETSSRIELEYAPPFPVVP